MIVILAPTTLKVKVTAERSMLRLTVKTWLKFQEPCDVKTKILVNVHHTLPFARNDAREDYSGMPHW